MTNENINASQDTKQNTGNAQNSGEQNSSSEQGASFNKNDYNDDPNNMANYTGNYGTGTYDTDYGAGEFPETNAKEQGDNWVDKISPDKNSGGQQEQNNKDNQ